MTIAPQQLTGLTKDHLISWDNHHWVHHQVKKPLTALTRAAQQAGFDLSLASSFRSFERQLNIWQRKYSGELTVYNREQQVVNMSHLTPWQRVETILIYSALPGASRHHWGTDVDVFASNCLPAGQSLQLCEWEYEQDGYFYEFAQWLKENAVHYDFDFPYQNIMGGIANEPWHISYLPVANLYQQAFSLAILEDTIKQSEIAGKNSILENLEIIYQRYISNLNPAWVHK
jgi:LAS superfamily LD-carboxypeptidase LdcB